MLRREYIALHCIAMKCSISTVHYQNAMLTNKSPLLLHLDSWMLQAVIAYGEDIINIIMISHFLGLRAMICYSNVWFFVNLTHIINSAWYSAIYKHVNIACGQETDEGYVTAGNYIKIGMAGNFFISIPTAILTVLCMPYMMNLLGYHQSIVDLSQEYSIVVVSSRLLSSTSGILNSVMDMEGRAKFVTIFEFWESLIGIILTLAFVTSIGPSLVTLGVFHLILDIVATGMFFFWVITKRGWYKGYSDGIFSPLSPVVSFNNIVPMFHVPQYIVFRDGLIC